jgi:hypothetical protein
MKKDIYITIYTKEQGKLEFTYEEWLDFDINLIIFHRIDGPAVEFGEEWGRWYIDNKEISKKDFDTVIQEVKSLPLEFRLTDPRWWVREMK